MGKREYRNVTGLLFDVIMRQTNRNLSSPGRVLMRMSNTLKKVAIDQLRATDRSAKKNRKFQLLFNELKNYYAHN